ALVRLADVDVHRVRHHDGPEYILVELRHERLQRVRLDRDAQPRHRRQHRAVTGGDDPDPAGRYAPEARLDPDRAAVVHLDAGHLTALEQVDAGQVGRPRVAPGDVLVPGDPAARLERRAEHRVADVRRDVDDRADLRDDFRLEPFAVD